jgi:hypothetical protein
LGLPPSIVDKNLFRPRAPREFAGRAVGIFRIYEGINFPAIFNPLRPTRKIYRKLRPPTLESTAMDTNTLLVILVGIFLFGGFGFYGRGRWF